MRKGLLIGGGAVGAVIAIVVVVLVFVLSNLDALVREAVEKVGSDATQARVSLDKVEISLKAGNGALNGLKVGNPKGFQTPSAFELGRISVTLDTARSGAEVVVIKEIVILKPKVTYELAGTASNVDAIKRNVDAYAKQFSSDGARKSGDGPKLIIDNLYIKGGEVGISAGFLKGKALSAPLPDVHLKDIGKEEKGADPAEVAQKVIDSMSQGASKAVSGLGLDRMMGEAGKAAGEAAKALQQGAGDAAKAAKEGAESVGKALEKGAGEAGEGLKKLFGK
jgi:hypothetical protein